MHNTAFVVNLDSLDAHNDIRADENGVWKRKGAPVGYVSLHGNKVVRRTKMKSFDHYTTRSQGRTIVIPLHQIFIALLLLYMV